MTSLSFQTAVQKNEAKLSSFVQFENEMAHAVIEHGMTSLSFQTAVQKNQAKLSSFVQFENKIASYRAL